MKKQDGLLGPVYERLKRRKPVYCTERPIWGPHSFLWSQRQVSPLLDRMYARAIELADSGGGLTTLQGEKLQREMMTVMLRALGGRLLVHGKKIAHIWGDLESAMWPLPEEDFVLVDNGPVLEDFEEALCKLRPGQVVISTGLKRDWYKVRTVPIRHFSYFLLEDPSLKRMRLEYIYEKCVADMVVYGQVDETVQQVYRHVAVFDSCRVAMPSGLLHALFPECEPSELVRRSAGLIMQLRDGSGLCAAGEVVSERMLEWLANSDPGRVQEVIVQALDPILASLAKAPLVNGRHALRRFLDGLALKGKRRLGRDLVGQRWESGYRPVILQADEAWELLAWGKVLGELGLFPYSKEVLDCALEKDPQNPFLLSFYGKMMGEWAIRSVDDDRRERYGVALQKLRHSLRVSLGSDTEKAKKDILVHQISGDITAKLGDFANARKLFQSALSYDSSNAHVLIALADALIHEGSSESMKEAHDDIQKVFDVDPYSPYAHHVLGVWYLRQWRHKEATEEFQFVLEQDPDNVAAVHSLGMVSLQRGHLSKARDFFLKAHKLDPENVLVLSSLGNLEIEIQAYNEAEEYFRKGLELEEHNRMILVSRIKLLLAQATRTGNYAAAGAAIERVKRITQRNPYLLTLESQLLMQDGKLDAACSLLEAVLEGWPTARVPALNLLAKLLARQGNLPNARQYLHESLDLQPYNQQTLCTWADIECAAREFQRSDKLLKKALKIDDANAYVWQSYARLWRAKGDRKKEKRCSDNARDLGLVVTVTNPLQP